MIRKVTRFSEKVTKLETLRAGISCSPCGHQVGVSCSTVCSLYMQYKIAHKEVNKFWESSWEWEQHIKIQRPLFTKTIHSSLLSSHLYNFKIWRALEIAKWLIRLVKGEVSTSYVWASWWTKDSTNNPQQEIYTCSLTPAVNRMGFKGRVQ